MTNSLELATLVEWKSDAARLQFGFCGDCGRNRDDDGKALLVARQFGCRTFQCVSCFSLRPTGNAARRAAR
ncbi:MAG: hypothetical protein ACJ76I_12000 [Gaiellaceae bacterium]